MASKSPLPLAALRARLAPTLIVDGAELAGFVRDARVLTDDYARSTDSCRVKAG